MGLQSWPVTRARISKEGRRYRQAIREGQFKDAGGLGLGRVFWVSVSMLLTNGPGFALVRQTPLEGDTQG